MLKGRKMGLWVFQSGTTTESSITKETNKPHASSSLQIVSREVYFYRLFGLLAVKYGMLWVWSSESFGQSHLGS